MLTAAQYADQVAKTMRENALQAQVLALARVHGWLAYHTHDSRKSVKGFPDLVLVHPARRLVLWRELKTWRGRVTPEQQAWLDALTDAGEDAGVWRPADLLHRDIERQLAGADFQPSGGHW